jgi:hypothetical protein
MTDQDVTSILHSRGKVVLIWLGAEMSTNLMNIWTHQKACKLVSKVIKLPRGGVRPSSAAVIGPTMVFVDVALSIIDNCIA